MGFYVELLGADGIRPYFFVQVKATRLGYTRNRRLRVAVSEQEVQRLAAYPAPRYLCGIDEVRKTGFLLSANQGAMSPLSSLSSRFPVGPDTRKLLWNEVHNHWLSRQPAEFRSAFSNPAWR